MLGGCCPGGREPGPQGLRRSVCISHVHTVILDVRALLARRRHPPTTARDTFASVVRKRSRWRALDVPGSGAAAALFTLRARHAQTISPIVGWGRGLAFHPQRLILQAC